MRRVPDGNFNFGVDVVDRWAHSAPHRPALLWSNAAGDSRAVTYEQVSVDSDRVATLLGGLGLVKGDRVIVQLPRIPEWQIVIVACHKLGLVPVPCTTLHTSADITYRASQAEASAIVAHIDQTAKAAELTHLVRVCVGGNRSGWTSFHEEPAGPPFAPAVVAAEDPAVMYFTSGSTGHPKGVVHAARALYLWRRSAQRWLGLAEGDVMWCTADTAWSKAGTSILYGPWSCGATVVFHDGPFNPATRLELLARHRVQCFCASPTELRRLLSEGIGGYDLSALERTVTSGEAVEPDLVGRWRDATGAELRVAYGQTETLMTIVDAGTDDCPPGAIGRVLPGVNVGVLEGDKASLAGPAEGELAVRADDPQLMLGYWRDPERTQAAHVQVGGVRWFRTGDLVSVDEDGWFRHLGRTDDLISSSGYRIGPQEVEAALLIDPRVVECAVAGVPDAERGEIVKAWVVLADSSHASEELVSELQAHVKRSTAPYKYPRAIDFVDQLPKTVTGKVQRNVLRSRG